MAKGETKKTNQLADTARQQSNQDFGGYVNQQTQRGNEAYGRSNDLYNTLSQGYGDLAAGKFAGLPEGASFGGGGYGLSGTYGEVADAYRNFMGGGGIDAGAARVGHGTLQELMGSGGYDAATRARIMGDVEGFREMGKTGGLDAEAMSRMRGGGVFDEFAKTGGLSDSDRSNMRARGIAPISAMYGGMTDQMNRQRRIGGGSSAGANAMAARLLREQSRAGADAALNTELGITNAVNQGRQWGAGSMSDAERQMQALRTGNMLAGLGGASSTEMGMTNAIAGNRLGAATNIGASEQNIQSMIQRGKMFGTQGLESVAGAETAAAASGAGAGAADARFRAQMQLEGLEGLGRLRGQNPGEVAEYNANQLAGIGGRAGMNADFLGMRYQAPGNNRSGWDTASNFIGAGAGLAGGLLMPGGYLGPKKV